MDTIVVECVMNISTRKTWQLELNATQITATEMNVTGLDAYQYATLINADIAALIDIYSKVLQVELFQYRSNYYQMQFNVIEAFFI